MAGVYGAESGVAIVAARVSEFRSLIDLEVPLNDLTVLIGANNAGKTSFLDALSIAIGVGRRTLGAHDVRVAPSEAAPPRDRQVVIDVMVRPISHEGAILDAYPEGSFWTNLWGATGIALDGDLNEFTGIRTTLRWSAVKGEYVLERRFLKEWRQFEDWKEAAPQDRPVTAAQIEPLALNYIDAKRDLDDDLRKPGSFWRRLTDDLGVSAADAAEMEALLSTINEQIVDKSAILKHLKENLSGLQNVVAADSGAVEIAPVARKLRDLSKGLDVSFRTLGAEPFPLARHGMGTRSLASLLVFRAYVSWKYKQATEGGDKTHSILALEEPESHLHPQAQRSLFSHIKKVSGQRIVSTHSPYFAGQANLQDLRLFYKHEGNTYVTGLDTSELDPESIRKLQDTVIDRRGDILFSRRIVLLEGQTEEIALPIYASKYWNCTIHELGFCFVCVDGTGYFPFIWMAKAFRLPWYVFSDGETTPIKKLNKALEKAGEHSAEQSENVIVLPSEMDFEKYLMSENYLSEIETAINEVEETENYLNKFIAEKQGQIRKGGATRDYTGENGRCLAALDYLEQNKVRAARSVATKITCIEDKTRQIPSKIEQMFAVISRDHGLTKFEAEQ